MPARTGQRVPEQLGADAHPAIVVFDVQVVHDRPSAVLYERRYTGHSVGDVLRGHAIPDDDVGAVLGRYNDVHGAISEAILDRLEVGRPIGLREDGPNVPGTPI